MLRPPSYSEQLADHMSDPGGDEPYLPETIYQRLDYLDSYALFQQQQENEMYDDASEDEDQLDLTAPPPES